MCKQFGVWGRDYCIGAHLVRASDQNSKDPGSKSWLDHCRQLTDSLSLHTVSEFNNVLSKWQSTTGPTNLVPTESTLFLRTQQYLRDP